MLSDFQLIKHNFGDVPFVNIYPLGDVHLGSKECNTKFLQEWVEMVKDDPYGYAVIVGDIMNMGLKSSTKRTWRSIF